MQITVNSSKSHDGCTISDVFVDDAFFCYGLEDTVREPSPTGQGDGNVTEWKIPNETAIPSGKYKVIIDHSAHFGKDMMHVLDVPGFEGVRIHGGNTAEDTEGCLLLGMQRTDDSIRDCATAVDALFAKVKEANDSGDEVWITFNRSF